MTKQLTPIRADVVPIDGALLNKLVTTGDLKGLTPDQQREYYIYRCRLLDLDPATQPFDLISLQGKLTLYAKKECAAQLSSKRGLSATIVTQGVQGDLYVVQARCKGGDGRETDDLGAVSIKNKVGDDLCNAMMKAATKAKRRAILSHCGLGMLDESELDTVRGSREAQQQVAQLKLAELEQQAQADLAEIDALTGQDARSGAVEQPPVTTGADSAPLGPPQSTRQAKESPSKPAIAPQGNPTGRVVPKISIKRMGQFAEAKAAIGSDAYYRILNANGYGKSNQIPTDKEAMRCLAEMGKLKKALDLERAVKESSDASLPCHRDGSGCSIPVANQIATCIKKLGTPLDKAIMDLQTFIDDRKAQFPGLDMQDHWNVLLVGLQDVIARRTEAGK